MSWYVAHVLLLLLLLLLLLFITSIQVNYNYIPETNSVSRAHRVAESVFTITSIHNVVYIIVTQLAEGIMADL